MIGKNYPAHKWARVFQADIINKNIQVSCAWHICGTEKEFCCGLVKVVEEVRGRWYCWKYQ